ncbi:Small-subunit processome, Utp14 [Corchorus capsularis]|uniref:Small-subunit processome, Utp14 n=1 Tax=Corchorus capsularis TaxID=210143 RepID=A0A1R3H0T9_COCAP|nr:Small-subunit processome, Utp14 [Corchorus capsularis]
MADKKRKERAGGGESRANRKFKRRSKKSKGPDQENKTKKKSMGPRLPTALRTELDRLNPRRSSDSDDDIDSDVANDVYEYEEEVPQEESGKNRRFDPVENYEYELPEDFEDENVSSDDDDDDEDDFDVGGNKRNQIEVVDHGSEGVEEEDDGRHLRMLQGITGMSSDAFEGKKKKNNVVISEAHPESEYNPTRDVLEGDGRITIQDLLDSIQEKPGYSKLRKRVQHMDRKSSTPIQAPLPKAERDKLERMAVYEHSKKDITKWEHLVKRNREAPTIFFGEDVDLGFSTVGAIASEFEPRTEFEKKIASLVYDDKVMEAHKADGSKLLELNKISEEEYMKNRNHIAKMRSLLFHHELKRKRIKKIKSKTYHRLKNKDKLKAAPAEMLMDSEAAKEQARKQEFKRAEERMTLKHKNKSKWARRILERGLNAQDEGTRAAMAEQLNQHALLTRKMNTLKDGSSSSSDSSSDEDDEGSDQDRASELLEKAKEKTLKILEEEEEVPNSGVLALPFMVRGMKKRKELAMEEAKLALQEYEKLEGTAGAVNAEPANASGRRVFGMANKKAPESNNKTKTDNNNMKIDNYYGNSDSEDDIEAKERPDFEGGRRNDVEKAAYPNSVCNEATGIRQDSVFKNFDDIVGDPGSKTTYEVSIFASDSWKKMKSGNAVEPKVKKSQEIREAVVHNQDLEEGEEGSDSDSEGQMVDGILSSGPKDSYELPSQSELIRHAFAGDDVEEEFEKDKQAILNEENPEAEKPVSLPGWGQWTHIQQKKGMPSWMLKEHEDAKQKREEALKKRKDAKLKHVIISEKLDKKTEKLQTKTLPYPFTSKEVFEQSMRMPIGSESNPETAFRALNRPEVVKKPGVIIKPIKFEEVHQHEKKEDHKRSGQKQKSNRSKGAVGKTKKQ